MNRIRRWFTRQPATPVHHVVIYSRPGCHLCEDARALLDDVARQSPLLLDEVDITQDPELVRRYDLLIPVIVIDGRTELTAPIDERKVRRLLSTG